MKKITDYISLDRLNIKEFEHISYTLNVNNTLNDPGKTIELVLDILEYLKADEDFIDSLTVGDIADFIIHYKTQKTDITPIKDSIIINNRIYEYKEIKGRRLIKLLEKVSDIDFVSLLLALSYEDSELTNTEHKSDAHIKYKQSLFSNELYKDHAKLIIMTTHNIIEANKKVLVSNAEESETV